MFHEFRSNLSTIHFFVIATSLTPNSAGFFVFTRPRGSIVNTEPLTLILSISDATPSRGILTIYLTFFLKCALKVLGSYVNVILQPLTSFSYERVVLVPFRQMD